MNFIDALFAFFGLIGGFGIGWMIFRQKIQRELATAVSRSQYDTLLQENAVLTSKLDIIESDKKDLAATIDQARRERTELHERAVTAEANKKALEQRLEEQRRELEKMQERLKLEFKNTATIIFEEISSKFTVQSEKKIGDLLLPLRERLNEFQKAMGESFTVQGKEQHTLKAEIERIVKMNEAMRLETTNLTNALRGDVKAQGNWGEVMLERILEEAGLQRDMDYVVQGSDMGLTGSDGNSLKPDVIIKLPENKHIIIDAKVSLLDYERYGSETDTTVKNLNLKNFLKSVKAHVNGLEGKSYQHIEKLGTPDFVLMFMPIEGAYSLAVQQDRELHSYAWGKKIVLVCPATLFATLRTVASLWRIERQNLNAQEIARQSGALYDKFVGFITDMEAIGQQMNRLQKNYDDACNKLKTGSGNLINRVENLKKLGAKASKSLPKTLIGDDANLHSEDNDDNIANLFPVSAEI